MTGVDFNALLKDAMGLDAASLGPSAITRAVQSRMAACQSSDVNAYWLRVRSSPAELQELIEAVVVPETWFFRDPAAFDALAGMARADLIGNPALPELRLLSLPCSSGEEPFSMAIALLEAGIPANRFQVDGVDISVRALEQAAHASYGSNSFRGQELNFRARHFRNVHGKWLVSDAVRERVHFQQGNLFSAGFLPGHGLYDYIFCRNVLIYFDQETQVRALQVLLRLLSPRGCLFVGPSETGLLPRDRLASAQLPMAFAFRHAAAAAPPPAPAARSVAAIIPRKYPDRRTVSRVAPKVSAKGAAGVVVERRRAPQHSLDQAMRLADQGKLPEAALAAEQAMREGGPSATAYCLLGVLREAAGDAAGAVALYRKALYLDSAHAEALGHLVLLLEKEGKADAARVLRERLRRIETRVAG